MFHRNRPEVAEELGLDALADTLKTKLHEQDFYLPCTECNRSLVIHSDFPRAFAKAFTNETVGTVLSVEGGASAIGSQLASITIASVSLTPAAGAAAGGLIGIYYYANETKQKVELDADDIGFYHDDHDNLYCERCARKNDLLP